MFGAQWNSLVSSQNKNNSQRGLDSYLEEIANDCNYSGIIPRTLHLLFQYREQHPESECKVSCSFFEIFNERIFDLLVVPLFGPGHLTFRPRKSRLL